ncbi:GNAT family N-acetyltransferase [Marinilactibacillus piezotolerans]|uniref:GNAT family N-acetyltransferase n=1 Tax=Marinilactibacillus piezotolerans TaxID=258723 RepID=UPI0009AFA88F|nr:GNAT family N-acetyltransferase [Marinilactibacillus piezotolerans]
MLVEFKSDYQKITMGLLSYVPDLKETTRLMKEIEWYQQEDNRQLYLWRSDETNDFAGVVGTEIEEEFVLVRHISVNPSYRDEGLAHEILDALSDRFSPKQLVGTIETGSLITKWHTVKKSNDSE